MKKVFLFFVSCLFFPFSYVEAANPLQEVNISAQPGTKSITSGSYANNLTMREERKVGIGVGAG